MGQTSLLLGLFWKVHSGSVSHTHPSTSAESSFGDSREEGNCSPLQRCGSKDTSAAWGISWPYKILLENPSGEWD